MKLLIATGIYPPEIGGPAGYVRGLASELARLGHEIAVVTYGDQKTVDQHQASEPRFGLTVVPRTGGPLVRYGRYMLAVRRLARGSDLVYLQGPVSEGLPGMLGTVLAGKQAVLKVVGDYAWEQYQQLGGDDGPELLDEFLTRRHTGKIRIFETIERWVAQKAKTVIVPSKYLKKVVERWNIPADKIKVIYNSISPLPYGSLEDTGSDSGRKTILTAIRAVPWKGGDFLCDCLKDLPSEYVLAVAGEGPCLEVWKKHAEDIGVADRVRWLGRLSRAELAAWYRKSDVFALATGYEGFPHVVVEACSVGLPCVVSDKGGNPETKDFFPSLVTVASYLDKTAWVQALESKVRSPKSEVRQDGTTSSVLDFGRMVEETMGELKKSI